MQSVDGQGSKGERGAVAVILAPPLHVAHPELHERNKAVSGCGWTASRIACGGRGPGAS
jgi:hypothetical protein